MTKMAITIGTAINGEIHRMATRKISTKGTSISAVIDAEAMKSRTVSKARRLAAKAPTDAGRASIRMPSTRSMISADSATSIRLLARSIR